MVLLVLRGVGWQRREVDNSSERGNGDLRFKTRKLLGHSGSKLKWLLEGIRF